MIPELPGHYCGPLIDLWPLDPPFPSSVCIVLDLPGFEDHVESNRAVAFSRQVRSVDIGAVSEELLPRDSPFFSTTLWLCQAWEAWVPWRRGLSWVVLRDGKILRGWDEGRSTWTRSFRICQLLRPQKDLLVRVGECVGFEIHLLQQGMLQECGSSGPGHRTFTQGRWVPVYRVSHWLLQWERSRPKTSFSSDSSKFKPPQESLLFSIIHWKVHSMT